MLHPHSLLWHYLWVGTDVLLLVLALLTWHRQLNKLFPAFFAYLVFETLQGLMLYAMDLAPQVSAKLYWCTDSTCVVVEMIVKLAAIWELFSRSLALRRPTRPV